MSQFSNKTVIITGAASGIGLALSAELGRRNATVIMTDIDDKKLAPATQNLKENGYTVRGYQLDVTDPAAVKDIINTVSNEYKGIDYLFNNAGIAIYGEAMNFQYDDWQSVIDVNLYGTIHGIMTAYPLMAKRGKGHIINIASVAGLIPSPGLISYTTSKYAVVGMSHALRAEAAGLGVKVSVVCPGFIDTAIMDTSKAIEMNKAAFIQMLGKPISPEKCAHDILTGIKANKATIFVSPMSRFLWILQRAAPSLLHHIAADNIKKLRNNAPR